jgi:C4-dicarboxylate transporter DctM subunit
MQENKITIFARIENWLSYILLILIILLLVIEVISRTFLNISIPGSADYLKHLVLWAAFLGAMITTRENKHLSLTLDFDFVKGPHKNKIKAATHFIACAVCTAFTITSVRFVVVGFDVSQTVGIIPIHFVVAIIPVGFLFITARFILSTEGRLRAKLFASSGILAGIFFSLPAVFYFIQDISLLINPEDVTVFDQFEVIIRGFRQFYDPCISILLWPLVILLIVSAFFGTPIFVILGGCAILFFLKSSLHIDDIAQEAYGVLTRHEIPAIPLFTFAGFLLSESKAGERFLKLFRSLLGWLPGGLAIVVVLICAFFTTFTGASGVTILALGGFLSVALIKRRYKEDFTYGILTGAGSVGLLFPPSLPVILYGVAAAISIKDLYVGGIIPGILLVCTLAIMGIVHTITHKVERVPFKLSNIPEPVLHSLPELLLPFIIFLSFFSGFATVVETGAIAIIYVLVIEIFIYKDIKIKDLPRVMLKSVPIMGGILIIMAIAKGFAYYIIDQQIPAQLTEWCITNIRSPLIFLLLLNIGLLITGCFLDIFAAIFVVAPLIIPLGEGYGIHPVHLGIIFLANLQLGYLTPPVGLNLFLASYCFNQHLSRIYKQVIPFFLAMLVTVLLITYVPPLTTMFLQPERKPGDAWFTREHKALRVNDPFTTEVHIDTGDSKLFLYEMQIEYEKDRVQLDIEKGFSGVSPSDSGFVTDVRQERNGIIIVKGIDPLGKLPNRDFYLLDIHWKALKKGRARIGIKVLQLEDDTGTAIGTSKGSLFRLTIK